MNDRRHYELPDLGYDFDALEPDYSAELLELHYAKHHQAYVDGANDTLAALSAARENRDFDSIAPLQRDLAFNVSGHVLHSLFWRNMSPDGESAPDGELEKAIDRGFGDLDALRAQFLAAGTSIQGSGWAALSWEPVGGALIVEQVHDHHGNIGAASVPLLVMDMWEHAFYLQYRNDKARWAKAFWGLIDWRDVANRFDAARDLDLSLRLDSRSPRQLRAMQ